MSFLEKNNDFNRPLTIQEKGIFTSINNVTGFPYFPQASTETIRFLAKGGEFTSDINSPLCEQYDCIDKNSLIYLYDKLTGLYISQLSNYDIGTVKSLCGHKDFECVTDIRYYATYNCIGWSIGVTKWVNPGDITAYVRDGKTITEAINYFLDDKANLYANSSSNILNIVDDLRSFSESSIKLSNNTVAFYFDCNDEFLHGARYVETLLAGESINRWTSKLGRSILISHDLDDLRGEHSMYGDKVAYAVVVSGAENQIFNNEEL